MPTAGSESNCKLCEHGVSTKTIVVRQTQRLSFLNTSSGAGFAVLHCKAYQHSHVAVIGSHLLANSNEEDLPCNQANLLLICTAIDY